MTRTMYDAIVPANIPIDDPQMVAGYVSGSWPDFAEMVTRFPDAVHVSVATHVDTDAMMLDIEKWDAAPSQAPAWCVRQRRRGQIPSLYFSESLWPEVRAAFRARNVTEPLYCIANANNQAVMIPGAIAHQYAFRGAYDLSIVADYWPGVDVAPPKHPKPKPRPRKIYTVRRGDTLSAIARRWHITVAELEAANPHAGHPAGNFDVIWPGDHIVLPAAAGTR